MTRQTMLLLTILCADRTTANNSNTKVWQYFFLKIHINKISNWSVVSEILFILSLFQWSKEFSIERDWFNGNMKAFVSCKNNVKTNKQILHYY